jgi:hypothetical protein
MQKKKAETGYVSILKFKLTIEDPDNNSYKC